MEQRHMQVLGQCPLFADIATGDYPAMLGCLSATVRAYAKGEAVFTAGEAVRCIGIVLAGGVHVEQDDYWGNRAILAGLAPADLFGEAFVCAGPPHIPVSVYATEESEILLVDYAKIIGSCSSACAFHARLIQNMLRILAQKNVALTRKIEALTQRTTRDKLMAYLSQQAQRAGKNQFTIPFNRQELADFLAVDRSAMSSELSRMQREGLLQFEKNWFELA